MILDDYNFEISDDENTYNNLERNGPLNLNIPIPFFFTKTFDVNLPLCAMSNTEIEIIIEFERLENLIFKLPSTVPSNFTKLSILSEVVNSLQQSRYPVR